MTDIIDPYDPLDPIEQTNPITHDREKVHHSFVYRWIPRLLFVFLLAVVLIIVNKMYADIATSEIIREGEAGDLLYVSAFDGFLDEWDLSGGQQSAQIVDDALEINVTTVNKAVWSMPAYAFADFDITIDTTAIDGPIDNAYGIIFRLQAGEQNACDLPMVILCGLGDALPIFDIAIRQVVDDNSGDDAKHYYTFLISTDGYYSVWEVENGIEQKLSAWIASPVINQDLNAKNTIRVVGRGSQFQFFINGEQMNLCIPNNPDAISTYSGGECIEGTMQSILTDDSIPTGQLGAIAQATQTGGGGVVVRFDNMIVFSPSKNVEKSESNA